jgi:hypothetical protein
MDKDAALEGIRDALRMFESAEKLVSDRVVRARLKGASWEELGAALGMTKQGAHKRYSSKLPYQYPLDV